MASLGEHQVDYIRFMDMGLVFLSFPSNSSLEFVLVCCSNAVYFSLVCCRNVRRLEFVGFSRCSNQALH